MKEIKFRALDKKEKTMHYATDENCWWFIRLDGGVWYPDENQDVSEQAVIMQFTGLHDKNGKEIWELMEINNKFRVEYHESTASYVLTNISTGDIMPIHETNIKELEVTGEYSPIS